MRIEFVGGVHEPVIWRGGTLRIGSAADNDVCLNGDGMAAHHVRLVHDRRGLVLQVEPRAGGVYVNARPVRECALVRLGDALGLGACRLRLCADALSDDAARDAAHRTARPHAPDGATMALRAVAGPLSGYVWPLAGRLELDAQGPLRVTRDAALRLLLEGDGVRMDATDLPPSVPVRVNGIDTRRARLRDGDQLAVGVHRFVVDVSATVERSAAVHPAPASHEPASVRPVHREMGWLIATAIVVALVLAWVLVAHL